jgi:hypothetical protein
VKGDGRSLGDRYFGTSLVALSIAELAFSTGEHSTPPAWPGSHRSGQSSSVATREVKTATPIG